MYYSIRHLTKFLYSNPVSESMMETRMHPRSDQNQRCLTFHLSVSPRCRVFSYRDHLANHVHHFDIPGQHGQLVIVAESLVEVQPPAQIPSFLAPDAWGELDTHGRAGRLLGDAAAQRVRGAHAGARAFADELDVRRRDDPLMVLHQLNEQIYHHFEYVPKSTKVDSPIDVALLTRAGVCQDFAHIMITLVRSKLRIPCRYVSGYLFHGEDDHDRSRQLRHPRLGRGATCRSSAGSASIPPTGWSPATATSAPPSAATTRTCRRRTASSAAAPTANLP